MKNVKVILFAVVSAVALAVVYGVLHNQISYTIAPEYFTNFKFQQFGMHPLLGSERLFASVVGVFATWWFGLLLGAVHGIVAMYRPKALMLKSVRGAIKRTLLVAMLCSVFGILVGAFIVPLVGVKYNVPPSVVNISAFNIAATMHNFSYLGGVVGLVYGVVYQLKLKPQP